MGSISFRPPMPNYNPPMIQAGRPPQYQPIPTNGYSPAPYSIADRLCETYGPNVNGDVMPEWGGGQGWVSTPPDVDWKTLTLSERNELSNMNDWDRAVLHLWGVQMSSKGHQDGGVYLSVMDSPDKFKPAERALVQRMAQADQARFGGITGRSLDEEFARVYQKMTGKDLSPLIQQAPMQYADGPSWRPEELAADDPRFWPVDTPEWDRALTAQNGLSSFENTVLRLWGHDRLDNAANDGSILAFTMVSANALDKDMNKRDVQLLLQADMAADGVANGDSLAASFEDVLPKLYLGKGGASREKTVWDSLVHAFQSGRSPMQVRNSVTQGTQNALNTMTKMIQEHPVATTAGVGGIAVAAAVCPFLGGLMAGGAGLYMGQKMDPQAARG